MQWLSPWAWLGLGALAVPVFVHLFSRRPARTEAFPSLRFLAVSPLAPTRRTRISDWPLLLLRLLVLALAVAALAQPMRSSALATAASRGTTIEVIDLATSGATSDANAARRADSTATVETIATRDLEAGIAEAIARLRTQRAPRTVAVRSSFPAGSLDSMFVAILPRDVALVLTPTAGVAASSAAGDTIAWQTGLPEREVAAVIDAVGALGGSPVVVVPDGAAHRARVLVVTATTATAAAASDRATPDALQAWSSDVALGVSRDAAVRAALITARVMPAALDSADDALALVRNARGDAVVVARERERERGTAATRTLVVASRVEETAERALALLLAASPARQDQISRSTDAPVDAATLARWERLPAGPAIGAGSVPLDVHTVPTDARWLWLAALIALGAEWVVRRRTRAAPTPDRA